MHTAIDSSLTDSIMNNPTVGTLATGTLLAASNVLPFIDGGHIKPMCMDVLQALAWITTIIVGTLTIIGWIRKFFFDKNKA